MRFWGIPNGDSLFRHAIYPLPFKSTSSIKNSIFVPEKLIKFYDEPNDTLLASLSWERYVPTSRHVHCHGCRTAFRQNEDLRKSGKFVEKNRRFYCGAYRLTAKDVRNLVSMPLLDEIRCADVVHNIEDGEIAHTDLRIVLKPSTNKDSAKTAIMASLWNACSGPLLHSCECDRGIDIHPSSVLSTHDDKKYRDSRSRLSRLWYVSRFRVLHWLWCVCTRIRHDPESES